MDGPPGVKCRRIVPFLYSNQTHENRKEINLLFTKGFTIIETYILHQCSEIIRELYD